MGTKMYTTSQPRGLGTLIDVDLAVMEASFTIVNIETYTSELMKETTFSN